MASPGPRVFDADELFDVDQDLRRQARTVREAAEDLAVQVSGLPPRARDILAGAAPLRGRLEHAADRLTAAAAAFGETGADAGRVDAVGLPDQLKAGVALLLAEGLELFLRRLATGRLTRLRADRRRHARAVARLHVRQEAARRAGDTALDTRLQRDIRRSRQELTRTRKAIRQTQRDVRQLRASGHLNGADGRAWRAWRELSGGLGFAPGSALSSLRDWYQAVRRGGSVPKAPGHRARGRRDARNLDPGRRLADSPALRKGLSVAPVLGAGVDVADLGMKAKKAWDNPNAGNILRTGAAGLHVAGNVPALGLLPDGAGYAIEGGLLVTDHVDDAVDVVDDAAGSAKDLLGKVF